MRCIQVSLLLKKKFPPIPRDSPLYKRTEIITYNNIPIKVLKDTSDICSPILNDIWCKAVFNGNFPSKLKLADIIAT